MHRIPQMHQNSKQYCQTSTANAVPTMTATQNTNPSPLPKKFSPHKLSRPKRISAFFVHNLPAFTLILRICEAEITESRHRLRV